MSNNYSPPADGSQTVPGSDAPAPDSSNPPQNTASQDPASQDQSGGNAGTQSQTTAAPPPPDLIVDVLLALVDPGNPKLAQDLQSIGAQLNTQVAVGPQMDGSLPPPPVGGPPAPAQGPGVPSPAG